MGSHERGTIAATEGALLVSRELDAPRNRVFEAWTQPEQVKRWWGPKDFTAPFCSIELRPGGGFFACMRSPENANFWSIGRYREVVAPERLVFTDSFADEHGNLVAASHYGMGDDWPQETLVTVTLAEKAGKTRLTLLHAGIPARMRGQCEEGWNQSLDKFAEVVGSVRAEA